MTRAMTRDRLINAAAVRILPILLAAASPLVAVGCADSGAPGDIERPPTIERPAPGVDPAVNAKVPLSPITSANGDRVIADISGVKVTESQLLPPLIASYGLDVLLKVTQLNMAKAEAGREGLTVSPADVDHERQVTMEYAFPGEDASNYPALMLQLLQRQHVSEVEFDLVMQTNAYLRAMVAREAASHVSEEMVKQEFNNTYGERVKVRHIALNNMQEVAAVLARLDAGEDFGDVAKQMSKYATTAHLGGALPPFSRQTAGPSPQFAEVAFKLRPGEWSRDPVNDGTFLHIIKLEERIAPKAVKYEDVRDSVRKSLTQRLEQIAMANVRGEMAERARQDLNILDPTLRKQFAERLAQSNPGIPIPKADVNAKMDQLEVVRQALEDAKRGATTRSATSAPATTDLPTTVPAAGSPSQVAPTLPPATLPTIMNP